MYSSPARPPVPPAAQQGRGSFDAIDPESMALFQPLLQHPPAAPAAPGNAPSRSVSNSAARASLLKRTQSARAVLAQPQAQPATRQRDKFVPLPYDGLSALLTEQDDSESSASHDHHPTTEYSRHNSSGNISSSRFEDLEPDVLDSSQSAPPIPAQPRRRRHVAAPPPYRGRITVFAIAEALNRRALEDVLRTQYDSYRMTRYSDVVHVEVPGEVEPGAPLGATDAFFFDYGVVVLWGMNQTMETEVINCIAKVAERDPLPPEEVDIDSFAFAFTTRAEPPHIQNDTFTINRRQAADHQVRLALSHALAQSVKLKVYEARVQGLVEDTRDMPVALARHGHVRISSKRLAQLIGKVLLQSSTVNLLSSVLDMPDFFRTAPDSLQALYERALQYLELQPRTDLLNARFQVLQELLDMLRDQQNNFHAVQLELVIIGLLVLDCVLMAFQMFSLIGLV